MKEFLLQIASVDLPSVSRCLGYGPDSEMHLEVVEKIHQCSREAVELQGIRGAYVELPVVDVAADGICIEQGKIRSRKLARVAGNADRLAFGLVTMGKRYDDFIETGGDLLDACVKDAVGTVLVEHGVDRLLQKIRQDLKVGTSLPFSPGYCDWDFKGQELVFSVFPPDPLGITLLEDSLMMSPQKSVSFVTCLGVQMKEENPCRFCTLKKCFMRRAD